MLVISCHSDTCRHPHRCETRGGKYYGHLDNYVGVHSVMKAYFSGRLDHDFVRIEFTYREEMDFEGAKAVRRTLRKHDTVVVVDVTGCKTRKLFTIEKCEDAGLRTFLGKTLDRRKVGIYAGCPDPVSDKDEVDIYRPKTHRVFFLGLPVTGGDYNARRVYCRKATVDAVADAICRIAARYPTYCRESRLRTR
jgi:hypothetical protein